MREKKYHIVLDDFQRRLIIRCLNDWRNELIKDGKPTEDVDELLLEVIDAKRRRF